MRIKALSPRFKKALVTYQKQAAKYDIIVELRPCGRVKKITLQNEPIRGNVQRFPKR